MFFLQSIC